MAILDGLPVDARNGKIAGQAASFPDSGLASCDDLVKRVMGAARKTPFPFPEATSPVRMLGVLASAIFVMELAIMSALGRLPSMTSPDKNLFDAIALVLLLSPAIYYLVFRPLTRLIECQKQAEAESLEYLHHLERLVEARTKELRAVTVSNDGRLAEKQILTLRRLYATLSHVNRTAKHAANWEALLHGICKGAVVDGKFELAWAGLVGHATRRVNPVCHYGREDGYLKNICASIDDAPAGADAIGLAIRNNQVTLVNDCASDGPMTEWCEQMLRHDFRSMAALPLCSGGMAIGALSLYSGEPGFFDDDHVLLLEDIASEISFALTRFEREAAHENVEEERLRAVANMQKALHDSIQAIAFTLEMRDPYTAGHQRQVARIATAIAREMGLPETEVEGVHFGSLIHDLGKISIPSEILTKPKRLTPVEMQLMQGHPQAGYDIIKHIGYPWPVAEMVLQHHERMDGSGYPNGLKGEEIRLESRILAVADVVDAMTSHRPYRVGLGIDRALEEIERNRGTYYDPLVVDACLRLFRQKGFDLGGE